MSKEQIITEIGDHHAPDIKALKLCIARLSEVTEVFDAELLALSQKIDLYDSHNLKEEARIKSIEWQAINKYVWHFRSACIELNKLVGMAYYKKRKED